MMRELKTLGRRLPADSLLCFRTQVGRRSILTLTRASVHVGGRIVPPVGAIPFTTRRGR